MKDEFASVCKGEMAEKYSREVESRTEAIVNSGWGRKMKKLSKIRKETNRLCDRCIFHVTLKSLKI